MLHRNC